MFPVTDNNHACSATQLARLFISSRAQGDGSAYDNRVAAAKPMRLFAACRGRAVGCMLTFGGLNNNA